MSKEIAQFHDEPPPTIGQEKQKETAFSDNNHKSKKLNRRLLREKLAAKRLEEIKGELYPEEKKKLEQYELFRKTVINGDFDLDCALKLTTLWNSDPPFVHRKVEATFREEAKNAGRDHGKLPKRRFSSLETCLTILGQGTLPTTSKEADRAIKDLPQWIPEFEIEHGTLDNKSYPINESETHPAVVTPTSSALLDEALKLSDLRDQLLLDEKTRGRHSVGAEIDCGLIFGMGLGGVQANVGVEIQPRHTETGHRKYDMFIQRKGKLISPAKGPVKGFHKKGVETAVSAAGISVSTGHPYRGDQVKGKYILELAAGGLSGFALEIPLPLLAPILPQELIPMIHALGYWAWLVKPQLVVNFQDERLRPIQDKFANASARISARINSRKNVNEKSILFPSGSD